MYIKPQLEKIGNIKKVTFSHPGWSCSIDCGSDDSSDYGSDDSSG